MHTFATQLTWQGGERAITSSEGLPDLEISGPVQFGGEAGFWTPEHQLVGAIESCILLTTLFFVDKFKIGMQAYASASEGFMDKGASGLRFTKMTMKLTVTVADAAQVEKMKEAVELAEKYCPLSNAVNFPVEISLDCSVA